MMCLLNTFMAVLLLQSAATQILPDIPEYISILNDKRDVSDTCRTQLNSYFTGLTQNESWAWNSK